jgi:hypothetical protein
MDIGKQAVGHLRVSTTEQGGSGNGLAAQRSALERFAQAGGFAIASGSEEWLDSVGKMALLAGWRLLWIVVQVWPQPSFQL